MEQAVVDQHIGLYVNEFTENLGEAGYAAVAELLGRAARRVDPSDGGYCCWVGRARSIAWNTAARARPRRRRRRSTARMEAGI